MVAHATCIAGSWRPGFGCFLTGSIDMQTWRTCATLRTATPGAGYAVKSPAISVHRRLLLQLAGLGVSTLVVHPATATDDVEAQAIRQAIGLNSNVVPALTLEEYLRRLDVARQSAWREIRDNIEDGKYKLQSDLLVLSPFDDVRECTFYIPWVLLRTDVQQAIECQEAYLSFRRALIQFDDKLMLAARRQAEEEDVWLAFAAMDAALDQFLLKVHRR